MPAKRTNAKAGGAPATASPPPLVNALLLAGSIGYAVHLLVQAGAMHWPPTELVQAGGTVAGCLALVGPLILWRGGSSGEASLGDLVWLNCGLLVWVCNLMAMSRGELPGKSWVTPVEPGLMGAFTIACVVASWKGARARWVWSWTSVVGGLLCTFWVVGGLASLMPGDWLGSPGFAGRLPRRPSWLP